MCQATRGLTPACRRFVVSAAEKKSSTQLREITTRRRGLVEQQHGTPNNKTGQTQLAKKKESQT
jgi:hypothetical protein